MTYWGTTAGTTAQGDDPRIVNALSVGGDEWLKQNAAILNFTFSVISATHAASALPTAGVVKWTDGTGGTFAGTVNGPAGSYSGFVVTWEGASAKTVTVSGITYDANGNQVGPTGLVVS